MNRPDDFEKIAKRLDEIARRHLPDHVIQAGLLCGCESEIRQEALILALGGFLEGNHEFRLARESNDDAAICNAMERCVAIALRFAKKRIASRLTRESRYTTDIFDESCRICHHPTLCKPSDWHPDVKSEIVIQAALKAVDSGALSVANASIVFMICEHGMGVAEVAEVIKITRSAIYQQLKTVKRVLPEFLDLIEVSST